MSDRLHPAWTSRHAVGVVLDGKGHAAAAGGGGRGAARCERILSLGTYVRGTAEGILADVGVVPPAAGWGRGGADGC